MGVDSSSNLCLLLMGKMYYVGRPGRQDVYIAAEVLDLLGF